MKQWEKVEKDCFEFLKENYPSASFEHKGSSDSSVPDIIVKPANGTRFNIEVKSASAHSGQFVLLAKDDRFILSKPNELMQQISQPIIDYMDDNFDNFKLPDTVGKEVNLSIDILAKWIEDYYTSKGVEFFATKYRSKVVVFPVKKVKDYFDISCTYRIKKSGSRNVPKKCAEAISKHFKKDYYFDGKRLILKDLSLKEKTIIKCHDCEFYVSEKRKDGYKITILGETKNANVIFKLKAKKKQDPNDLMLFEEALK